MTNAEIPQHAQHEPPPPAAPPIPARVRFVAFDLDGTLADTFEDIAAATNRALKAFGCAPLETAAIKRFVGRGVRHLMARALGPGKDKFADAAAVLWTEYYERHATDRTRLCPGAVQLLEWLRACNIATAVLSNKPDNLTQQITKAMGLAERVDFIRGESGEFPRKPDPAVLHHLASLYGVRPAEMLVVGDGVPDLEFARRAGAAFCAVLTGQLARDELTAHGVDWIVETLEVLHRQLEESGACRPS
jgi:phosphoglycolate phosphatase